MKTERTVGFEIEGFVDDHDVVTCELENYGNGGMDGSLYDGGYRDEIEFRTKPTKNLEDTLHIYKVLNDNDLLVNDSCGLHIHVDIADYTLEDKAKLLRFGKGIERVMFALVDESRDGNGYSEKLARGWRYIFREKHVTQPIPFDTFDNDMYKISRYVHNNRTSEKQLGSFDYGRPKWINPATRFDTVEYRIFNSTHYGMEAVKFGMLAYHITETVKHSTIEQLEFLIKTIYQGNTEEEIYGRFFDGIGLANEYRPTMKHNRASQYIRDTFLNNEPAVEVAQ